MPNNVGNLGKMIVATGFELLPKVQKIAQSGHTDGETIYLDCISENRFETFGRLWPKGGTPIPFIVTVR